MYEYFKNITQKTSCAQGGACSLNPSLNSLYEILLGEIREISFYLVKLKEFGLTNQNAMELSLKTLATFLINTNFNQQRYLNLLNQLYILKKEIKVKYIEYCTKNQFPCEIINTDFEFNNKLTINDLIKQADIISANKQKNFDKTKLALFELIIIFARLVSINIVKIKKLDKLYTKYDFEIIRFFALTNGYSIRNEKIIRRIKEFCEVALEIRKNLSDLLEKRYGKKQGTSINTSYLKGHCILVSGDDLDELEKVLSALEDENLKEEINVYTNGPLFSAHYYPFFQNNKFLKGHFGSDSAEYDFSIFPGSILITSNFIQKIDSLYKGEIFSNKLISFDKVVDIKDDDYSPLINSSLKLEGFLKYQKSQNIDICYDEDKLNQALKDYKNDEIIIVTGKTDRNFYFEEYKTKKTIDPQCSCTGEVPLNIVKTIKEKNIDITIFFAQCNLENLEIVLSLLNQDINIYLADCSYILVNPHVLECLKNNFNVKIIN